MSAARVVLLCEDTQTDAFVRRFLRRRRLRRRDINTLPLPAGGGSAEQWVRKAYPRQLKAIRGRSGACLVVVVDGDTRSRIERLEQLRMECERQEVPPTKPADPVLVFVPRRNIETWFAYLDGEEVNERDAYPKLPRESDCSRHANELAHMCNEVQKLREPAPPSLRDACEEYPRLTGILR